ncbi:hypothetical protein J6590_043130 [Homalodisca vitripennis]|nr:hypothetical protein J6590_043130 [Homalodisca vitripennis]
MPDAQSSTIQQTHCLGLAVIRTASCFPMIAGLCMPITSSIQILSWIISHT